MEKLFLNHSNIEELCLKLGGTLGVLNYLDNSNPGKCYPIPRGGIPAAYALASQFNLDIVDNPHNADFFFDDVIDSGATMGRYCDQYPGKPFLALIDKLDPSDNFYKDRWIVFPWEVRENGADESVSDNVVRILEFVGEDPNREGLRDTPRRVQKAFEHWTKGYREDPAEILKVFEDGGEKYDQMVTVANIPIYSKCEHHLADIFGTATISYIPDGKIVGLSKLSRLADVFARRLQVQERLTDQIADAIDKHLQPKGVGVVIRARHMCMESRGICQQGHHTVTTALRGAMRDEPATRSEFLALAQQ